MNQTELNWSSRTEELLSTRFPIEVFTAHELLSNNRPSFAAANQVV